MLIPKRTAPGETASSWTKPGDLLTIGLDDNSRQRSVQFDKSEFANTAADRPHSSALR